MGDLDKRPELIRWLAKWLADRDGVFAQGLSWKSSDKYEAYLEEAEELVREMSTFGFIIIKGE